MNKSKLAVGLMTLFLTGGVLASCDSKETREINKVRYSNDGTILTYTDESGDKTVIKADELFVDYYSDSSKYQSIFDSIYSIVVRNYFNIDEDVTYLGTNLKVGKSQMEQIKIDAQYKVDSDIRTAKKSADNKNTNYKDELEEILNGKGVKDTEELFDKYVEECQKETFDENFYKYHINEIKNGADDVKTKKDGADVNLWTGYFNDMAPYHVSHILVKLEDGSGTNYANGTISEDNAKKLFDVVDALGSGKDSFGTIAYQFSEDPGSADNGGLYEDIKTDSSYVKPFLDWCFEDGRKVGDYGLVDTEYGTHIMYISSISDKPVWQQNIITNLTNDASQKFYDGIISDKAFNGKISNGLVKGVSKRINKYAEKVIANLTKQAETAASQAATQS